MIYAMKFFHVEAGNERLSGGSELFLKVLKLV